MSPLLKQIIYLRETEGRINKNLFWVTVGITIISMGMVSVAFLSRGSFPADKMHMFYLGVVIVYSFHKELLRWLSAGEERVQRQGEYFVYGWITLTTLFYTLNFITKDYFSYSSGGESVETLRETATLTVEILVIFFLTRGLKILRVIWELQK